MPSKSCNFLPGNNLPISFRDAASTAAFDGYQVFLSSVKAPPKFFKCLSHSASDNLSFLIGLQCNPFPSKIPSPVMAILVCFSADIGD